MRPIGPSCPSETITPLSQSLSLPTVLSLAYTSLFTPSHLAETQQPPPATRAVRLLHNQLPSAPTLPVELETARARTCIDTPPATNNSLRDSHNHRNIPCDTFSSRSAHLNTQSLPPRAVNLHTTHPSPIPPPRRVSPKMKLAALCLLSAVYAAASNLAADLQPAATIPSLSDEAAPEPTVLSAEDNAILE